MSWISVIVATLTFFAGWAAGTWQCSRRRDCPRYAAQQLSKWKKEVEQKVGRGNEPERGHPTPVQGVKL